MTAAATAAHFDIGSPFHRFNDLGLGLARPLGTIRAILYESEPRRCCSKNLLASCIAVRRMEAAGGNRPYWHWAERVQAHLAQGVYDGVDWATRSPPVRATRLHAARLVTRLLDAHVAADMSKLLMECTAPRASACGSTCARFSTKSPPHACLTRHNPVGFALGALVLAPPALLARPQPRQRRSSSGQLLATAAAAPRRRAAPSSPSSVTLQTKTKPSKQQEADRRIACVDETTHFQAPTIKGG